MIDDALIQRVKDLIESGMYLDEEGFVSLCRSIAGQQGNLSAEPGMAGVKPVPESAFKQTTVSHFPPGEAQAVFRTSGTTTGTRGRNLVRDLDLYRASVLGGFERFVMYPPRPHRLLSLIPSATTRPDSSLSHMVSMVADVHGGDGSVTARKGEELQLDLATATMERATKDNQPLLLLGTSLDFRVLFAALRCRGTGGLCLPAGSRAMHTGGDKASGRAVSREELWAGFRLLLEIEPDDVIEEFGMTELMSQAYDSPRILPGNRRLVPVPWMRTRVLDPTTLTESSLGEKGLLCHYDLANCHTAIAILSNDLARRAEDGFSEITRVPGATPRGCSHDAMRGLSGDD